MTPENMKLGNQPYKLLQDLTLLQNEKCIVKASTGTLALPILVDEDTRGHFFAGKGQFTLDAIVETPRGAVGEPLVKDLTQPFLMFGEVSNIQESFASATVQDISDVGYGNLEEFLAKANDVFNRFLGRRHTRLHFEEGSYVFAFVNERDKWDILVSKGEKLVYTSKDKVFISKDKGETVSVHPSHVFVTKRGKTVVIDGDRILVDSSEE